MLSKRARLGGGGGQGQRGRFDRNTTAAARGFYAGKGSRVGEVRTTLKGEIKAEIVENNCSPISQQR